MNNTAPPSPSPADELPLARRRLGNAAGPELAQALARVGALIGIYLTFGFLVPGGAFFSAGNAENILTQSAVYALAGLGMTIVIIVGGIDLAAGSIIALSMVVTALSLRAGGGDYFRASPAAWGLLSIALGAGAGALIGFFQGLLITGLRLAPFIVTLGGLQVVRGLTKGVADNKEIIGPANNWLFKHLMFPVQGRTFSFLLFPVGVWFTLIAAVVTAAMLRYTKLGRRIYAVGSSEATARLCGVPVSATKIAAYSLAGVFAGLAGVLEFSKLNLGQPTGAQAYELYVIAACVIGGCSLRGGVGTVSGTVVGALIIATLNAGAQQADWPKWVQEIVIGCIIVAAVALDRLRDWRASRG